MSSPSSRTREFGLTVARLVSSPITARAVTDLPEPDSPTIAIVSPLRNWNDIERTASTVPRSTLNVTARSRASINDGGALGPESKRSAGARFDGVGHQYGSTASRKPSPSALKAKTVASTKPTGARIQG